MFEFNREVKTAEAARGICSVYGENDIKGSMTRKWLSRFKEGHFDVTDCPRTTTPLKCNEDSLNVFEDNIVHLAGQRCPAL